MVILLESHLLQMRGLKLELICTTLQTIWSHLLQMRGLKLYRTGILHFKGKSHLLQMRGLKPYANVMMDNRTTVASFTDAWIETGYDMCAICIVSGRIFYRCVD